VFGILKRGDQVCAQTIPNASAAALMPIMEAKIKPDSIVYTDAWHSYNALDVLDFKHHRINKSQT